MKRHEVTRRQGFTLVELLVVVAILAILASLSFAALSALMKQAHVQATRGVVVQVHDALTERTEAFFGFWTDERYDPTWKLRGEKDALLKGGDQDLAILLWKIDHLRSEFPQEFGDFLQDSWSRPDSMPEARRAYIEYYNDHFRKGSHDPDTESAECLYLILSLNNREGMTSAISGIQEKYIQDTDNDGLLEIVDSWGNPLRFYRWPVDLVAFLKQSQDISIPENLFLSNLDEEYLLTPMTSKFKFKNRKNSDWTRGRRFFKDHREEFESKNSAPAKIEFDRKKNNRFDPWVHSKPRHRYFRLSEAFEVKESKSKKVEMASLTPPDPDDPEEYPIWPTVISAGADEDFGLVSREHVGTRTPGNKKPKIKKYTYDQLMVRCARVHWRSQAQQDNIVSILLRAEGN